MLQFLNLGSLMSGPYPDIPDYLKNVFLLLICLSQDPNEVYTLHLIVFSLKEIVYI